MISVIIPTFRSPDALDLCLGSAIGAQLQKNQIIVVVDGFYDINKEVLEKYSNDIDILNLEENVGLCRATNLGVCNAKYDTILIVNDDNVFPINWDSQLENVYNPHFVVAPNQIEPNPSMFRQFHIKNLGQDPKTFDLKEFWRYEVDLFEVDKTDMTGSTLPILMSKKMFLSVGGWDENYQDGMVADWDFFLKCQLIGLKMMRTYNCNFYHFASVSVNGEKRQQAERNGHEYAKYKWGDYIKHNPENNLKYI
jgi:glycosyltransferase involved in cell wall biosynthesis